MNPLVVKVGGSLYDWPELGPKLAHWLEINAPSQTLIVPGGGPFADLVRKLSQIQHLDDETAHWMALRSMTLGAGYLTEIMEEQGCDFHFVTINDVEDRMQSWRRKDTPILDAFGFCRNDSLSLGELPHSWIVTSDSVAARTAELFNAELVLLKSADPPPGDVAVWAAAGYVDAYFPTVVARAKLSVRAINLRTA